MAQCAAAAIRHQCLFLEISINNFLLCSSTHNTSVGKQCLNHTFHSMLVNENGRAVKCFEVFHDQKCSTNNTILQNLREGK